MASLVSSLVFLLAASAPATAEHLKVVWSQGSFSTITGTNGEGGGAGSFKGFGIFNEAGTVIYDQAYPDDHSPCYNTGDGRTFTIEGDCWASPRQFYCMSDFAGFPETCKVLDASGNVLAEGSGQTNTEFIGIAIGQDGSCVLEFDSEDNGTTCPEDTGNGPLHVTSG
ncbi:uncharacterized protein BDV17DRAFT_298778 [Aspergillus undulatus]|uniref:uncharacterized protein n=1 Tax=Aspergillus undulatus TaxID=1810928 RepID=UPI003CCE142A